MVREDGLMREFNEISNSVPLWMRHGKEHQDGK
jgi:hypothetical protein